MFTLSRGHVGPFATIDYQPRQARKGAAAVIDSGAGVRLMWPPFWQERAVMSEQALARRWRPTTFETVVGQSQTRQALTNALNHQRLHHAYLFTGTRGVGKTTLARILAKALNCETGVSATPCGACSNCLEIDTGHFPDLYEIDAASRTKVEDTRELLDNAQYATTKGRYKIYLIDEVHMLSGHSFNALLKTLEEPPEHVKFILATTDPQKLPATVLSRCLQFHLHQLSLEDITQQLQTIIEKESVQAAPDALALIAKAAKGSMRDALSLLDQSIALCNDQLETEAIRSMLGSIAPDKLHNILKALAEEDGKALMTGLKQLTEFGTDGSQVLAELLSTLHQIAIEQTLPNTTPTPDPTLLALAKTIPPETVQLYYQIGLHGQRDLPYAPSAQSALEMTLIRMLAFTPKTTTLEIPRTSNPAKPTATTEGDWHTLFAQLNLTGTTALLAKQCSQLSKTDSQLSLALDPKHKPLLQEKHVKRIQDAVQTLLQKPIKVTVSLEQSNATTPAEQSASQEKQRQDQAKTAIYNDETVQAIIKNFDATVIEESITPTNDT